MSHLIPGKAVVAVKLSRKARAKLASVRRVKLTLVAKASDAAGNVRTRRVTITLRG